jgi:hypothetical protein
MDLVSCRRATSTDLCALACGRRLTVREECEALNVWTFEAQAWRLWISEVRLITKEGVKVEVRRGSDMVEA